MKDDLELLDCAIRSRFTEREYRLILTKLRGASEAIELVRTRALDLLNPATEARTIAGFSQLNDDARQGLEQLIAALIEQPRTTPIQAQLRLVSRNRRTS